jgi:tRNA(Ile)-lysidine synthase
MARSSESRATTHVQTALRRALIGRQGVAIAAVSGGVDSLVMLHGLAAVRHRLSLDIVAATFDHGLRGADSAADAAFVEAIAQRWGFVCVRGGISEGDRVQSTGIGIEAAARRARFAFLAHTAHMHGAGWVLLAQHADDQAETVLGHLVRGAGIHGLGGMRPDSPLPGAPELRALRPMLGIRRRTIEVYAQAHGLSPRHDITNDDITYTRNYLRHVVLPSLTRINPRVVHALARLADHASRDAAYLDSLLDTAVQEGELLWFEGGRAALGRTRMQVLADALAVRAIMRAAAHVSSSESDDDLLPISSERVDAVLSAVRGAQPGVRIEIGNGVCVRITRATAWVERADEQDHTQQEL